MRKVRKSAIPQTSRDIFERYGEEIIASIVCGGFNPRATELRNVYQNDRMINEAIEWLTERGDAKVLHEQRLEFVEWSILIFVIVSVILDGLIVWSGLAGH
jgi:hypothetical protein